MNYNELITRLIANAGSGISAKDIALRDAATAINELTADLEDERYRHDRLQDFEVAQAQELSRVKAERDAAVEGWRGFCVKCKWNDKQYLLDGKPDERCVICRANNKCNWKWRGPQKEE